MSLIKPNFPCKCGHEARFHEEVDDSIYDEWCNGSTQIQEHYFNEVLIQYSICECHKYIPDNLKYLEEEYIKRNNGNK